MGPYIHRLLDALHALGSAPAPAQENEVHGGKNGAESAPAPRAKAADSLAAKALRQTVISALCPSSAMLNKTFGYGHRLSETPGATERKARATLLSVITSMHVHTWAPADGPPAPESLAKDDFKRLSNLFGDILVARQDFVAFYQAHVKPQLGRISRSLVRLETQNGLLSPVKAPIGAVYRPPPPPPPPLPLELPSQQAEVAEAPGIFDTAANMPPPTGRAAATAGAAGGGAVAPSRPPPLRIGSQPGMTGSVPNTARSLQAAESGGRVPLRPGMRTTGAVRMDLFNAGLRRETGAVAGTSGPVPEGRKGKSASSSDTFFVLF